MIKVSLAGPLSNILVAFLFAILYRLNNIFLQNVLFNNLSHLSDLMLTFIRGWIIFLQTGVLINLALALFNLLPIPPLDGQHILLGILPPQWAKQYAKISHTYGMIILLVLIFTGFIGKVLFPIVFIFSVY